MPFGYVLKDIQVPKVLVLVLKSIYFKIDKSF
jgi:hypothetical protein